MAHRILRSWAPGEAQSAIPAATLDKLILGAYDAALDPDRWPAVLAGLAEYLDSSATHLLAFEAGSGRVVFGAVAGVPDDDHSTYAEDFSHRDLRLSRLLGRAPGSAYTDEILVSPGDVRRCPVHNDFLAPRHLRHLLGMTLKLSDTEIGVLGLLRSARSGPYGQREAEALERLAGHFTRAMQVQSRLLGIESRATTLSALADALVFGLLVTDASGQVRYANATGESILADDDGLSTRRGQLVAALRSDTEALHRLIAAAAPGSAERRPGGDNGALGLSRPSGKQALQLLVLPLAARSGLPGEVNEATATVVVTDPAERRIVPTDRLVELYGLTQAEADVAASLARGWSLRRIAESRSTSIETVRKQLKSVFDKTGAHRQAALVGSLQRSAISTLTRSG